MTSKRILTLRNALGFTQAQLAAEIGASRETVARWELGQHTPRGGYLKSLLELEKKVKSKKN